MSVSKKLEIIAKPVCERKIIFGKNKTNQILENVLNDPLLNYQIQNYLPKHYNFDLFQIISKIKENNFERVGLQFPEGLFIFSFKIADIIEQFANCTVIIFGDVSYGACCIDDYLALITKCNLLIHFAHSCLIPFNAIDPNLKIMYVVVDIKIDTWHLFESFKYNFPKIKEEKIAICSTIQFISTIQLIASELTEKEGYNLFLPQVRPLSRGEIIGCTAPKLNKDITAVFFVADGRFHLEAVMIANPWLKRFYKYNPYNKLITLEHYEFDEMVKLREKSLENTVYKLRNGCTVGLILGTLGRQGSPKVLEKLKSDLKIKAPNCSYLLVLLPEIKANILNAFQDSVDVWVQTSCPRLSIDWGNDLTLKPLLNPYEFILALNLTKSSCSIKNFSGQKNLNSYPMDYYASQSLGNWTPNHKCNQTCSCEKLKAM